MTHQNAILNVPFGSRSFSDLTAVKGVRNEQNTALKGLDVSVTQDDVAQTSGIDFSNLFGSEASVSSAVVEAVTITQATVLFPNNCLEQLTDVSTGRLVCLAEK